MNSKIAYSRNDSSDYHYKKLRSLVNERLKELPPARRKNIQILAVILPSLYVFIYLTALSQINNIPTFYSLYCLMGIVIVFTFLSVIHETVHGNLSTSSSATRGIMCFLDLSGANSYIWKKRHVTMHHNFPNIRGWDTDIQQSGIIKIYPHGKPTGYQRYQHIFFIFLYPLYLINWVFIRDLKDFFSEDRLIQKTIKIPQTERIKMLIFKAIYVFYMLLVPIMLGLPVIHAFLSVISMLILAGVFALVSLLTPHANIKSEFPLPDDKHSIRNGWFLHQFHTTNDISVNNWMTRNLMGNFNYHLAHHLFPNISCTYAPEITEVIRNYAKENDLPYRTYPLMTALKYHFLLLKQNAQTEDIFEEDM
jgi:linoleoyl-CoA desaturase